MWEVRKDPQRVIWPKATPPPMDGDSPVPAATAGTVGAAAAHALEGESLRGEAIGEALVSCQGVATQRAGDVTRERKPSSSAAHKSARERGSARSRP